MSIYLDFYSRWHAFCIISRFLMPYIRESENKHIKEAAMWNRTILTICLVFVLPGLAFTGDMTHVPDRDFDKLRTAGNRNPTGIWSDGTTMWVADRSAKIYAYNMRTRARGPRQGIQYVSRRKRISCRDLVGRNDHVGGGPC